MADYVVSTKITLKDEFTKGIKKARTSFRNFRKDMVLEEIKLSKGFAQMKTGIGGVASELKTLRNVAATGIGIGAAVGAGVWNAYSGYAELNKQLVRNRALSGANSKDVKMLENQVKELGRTTSFTAKQVAEAQQYQFMAGYDPTSVLRITPKLLKLSVASGQDLASTSDIVTDSLTAFGLSVDDLDNYLDVLVQTANRTNTDIGKLGHSFQYIAPVSNALGEDFKEVAVMLGILADNGIKGEKSGTALRGIYSRLSKPTKDMAMAFGMTNTKLYDQQGRFKGLRKIIQEAKPQLLKMGEAQRNWWLTTVAGTEGMTAWTSIMNNAVESTKKAETAVYNADGALEKFYKTMTGADQQTIDEMKSAFEGMKNAIGEAVSPIMLEGMKKVTGYMNNLTDSGKINTENIKSFFKVLKDESMNSLKYVAGVWGAVNLLRAGLGDPTALANLGLGAAALGTALGVSAGKRDAETVNKKQESFRNYQIGNVRKAAANNQNLTQFTPTIRIDMSNATFNGNGVKEEVEKALENAFGNVTDKLILGE